MSGVFDRAKTDNKFAAYPLLRYLPAETPIPALNATNIGKEVVLR
jgi:hypothetical protein